MRATIDKAGRLVIPKPLRDQVGMHAGEVEIEVDGVALRVQPVAREGLERRNGWLVIPRTGQTVSVGQVRAVRDADQK